MTDPDRFARRVCAALGLALITAACGEAEDPLRVGSKDFTEQLILGELIAQVVEAEGIRVDRQIPYGGTFENIEALKRGDIDLYPEYNGTGLILLGQPPISDGDEAYQRVEELYEPLGLEWGERLGFANDYELVMREDTAEELGIRTISDLATIEGGVSFGIDEEFQERPVDGFSALLRRYGLTGTAEVVAEPVAAGKARLYQALLQGEVDVVEGFTTDGQIAEYGLRVLEDDLDFFPTYEPAPLIRNQAMQQFPALDVALQKLAGTIEPAAMREMNAAVELEGMDPADVARRFLAGQGIIEVAEDELVVVEELTVAVGPLDARGDQIARAVSAVRKAFQGRNVSLLETPDPMAALTDIEARLALVDASAFFNLGEGVFPNQNVPAQALGVVGYDMAHVITRRQDGIGALGEATTVGIGVSGGASEKVARMVLTSFGLTDRIELAGVVGGSAAEALETQLAALRKGELDALFLMVSTEHPAIDQAMQENDLRLLGLPEWQQGNNLVRFPFLRVARVPAGTYPGQDEPIDTIASQVVLAGPARAANPIGAAGPGSAAIGEIQPLADKNITALNQELASAEQLDPALPSPDVLRPQARPKPAAINPSTSYSVVNLIVILISIFLAYLYFRAPPKRPQPSLREPARPRSHAGAAPPSGDQHV